MNAFALVGGGRVSDSFVARLPRLARDLGPVAALSYRVASRIARTLRAGHAVPGFQHLQACRLILLCVPAKQIPGALARLSESLDWPGPTVLDCGPGADSRRLAELREQGAAIGSLRPVAGLANRLFVAEVDPAAVRAADRLAGRLGGRTEIVETERLDLYLAALTFGSSLFTPLLAAAADCLREAGLSKAGVDQVSGALFEQSLRGYQYSGNRSWRGPLAAGDSQRVMGELSALSRWRPRLAGYYRDSARFALGYVGRHSKLRDSLGLTAAAAAAAG
ncbi:MAG: DUF2520 domain-containing protein [Acidobacteria bacterium]|nr:DUF2520 domain-containing protein [Acidobacteriota bacterium]